MSQFFTISLLLSSLVNFVLNYFKIMICVDIVVMGIYSWEDHFHCDFFEDHATSTYTSFSVF